jgi:hypothetical protein
LITHDEPVRVFLRFVGQCAKISCRRVYGISFFNFKKRMKGIMQEGLLSFKDTTNTVSEFSRRPPNLLAMRLEFLLRFYRLRYLAPVEWFLPVF